jgi:hypothetical protein
LIGILGAQAAGLPDQPPSFAIPALSVPLIDTPVFVGVWGSPATPQAASKASKTKGRKIFIILSQDGNCGIAG